MATEAVHTLDNFVETRARNALGAAVQVETCEAAQASRCVRWIAGFAAAFAADTLQICSFRVSRHGATGA